MFADYAFLLGAIPLFALVFGVIGYVLIYPPNRIPASVQLRTRRVEAPLADVVAALRGVSSFPVERVIEAEDEVTFVLSGPMTVGLSTHRTHGHWLFLRARRDGEGATIDLGIRAKWIESGAWAHKTREERLAKLADEVGARLAA